MNLLPMCNPTTVNIGENVAYIKKELWKEQTISEYDAVINAAYVIYSFLKDHEETSGTAFWKSNIDGTILTTDWGYFEEGLEQIKMYCERLSEGSRP